MSQRQEIIEIADVRAAELFPDARFESVTGSAEFEHWVVRYALPDDRFILVEGANKAILSVRGPLGGNHRINRSLSMLQRYMNKLSKEERIKAEVLYEYEGEEAMEEYLLTLRSLVLDPPS